MKTKCQVPDNNEKEKQKKSKLNCDWRSEKDPESLTVLKFYVYKNAENY